MNSAADQEGKRTRSAVLVGVLAVILAGAAHQAAAITAGAAKVEITPDLGVPLNGRQDRLGFGATSVHDPLWVRALYLDDETAPLFLITADVYAIPAALRERVLEYSPVDVPPENVILIATGTHNGPGGMDRALAKRVVSGRYMQDLVDETARGFAEAMRAAYNERRRGTIGFATTTQAVLSRNAVDEGGPRMERIGVVRVDDVDGIPIAILGCFGAPANTLGEEFRFAFSADFPGVFCDRLEELSSPGCVAFFLPGAGGDQAIVDPENNEGWARTESVGNLLAVRVKGLANNIQGRDLLYELRTALRPLPRTLAKGFLPAEAQLRVFCMDDLAMAFVGGLPYAALGLRYQEVAEAAGYDDAFLVGLAGADLGYHASLAHYAGAHGERWPNHFGPGYERWLTAATRSALEMEPQPAQAAEVGTGPQGRVITVSGGAYARGRMLGETRLAELWEAFDAIKQAAEAPEEGDHVPYAWKLAPKAVDVSPLTLPRMAANARARLRGIGPVVVEELLGLADGAELAFDALWLVQTSPPVESLPELVGLVAEREERLLGAVWAATPASSVRFVKSVSEERPSIEIVAGPSYQTLAGMNAPLVVCAMPPTHDDRWDVGTPAHIAMKHVLRVVDSANALAASVGEDGLLKVDRDAIIGGTRRGDWFQLRHEGADTPLQPIAEPGFIFRNVPDLETPDTDAAERLRLRLLEAAQRDALSRNRARDTEYILAVFQPGEGEAMVAIVDTRQNIILERTLRVESSGQ